MRSRKRLLQGSRLYLVADRKSLGGRHPEAFVSGLLGNGIDIIQLRDKLSSRREVLLAAQSLAKLLRRRGNRVLFIVNDFIEVALMADSDGVHLGQDDLSVATARLILGKDRIIGKSCHSLAQARRAVKEGADYIGIGPVFETATKPGRLPIGIRLTRRVCREIKVPVFPIGGIDHSALRRLRSSGIQRAAVCKAICRSRDPAASARRLKDILTG